jgi:hypothetical protein
VYYTVVEVTFDKSDLIREGLLYNTLIREVTFGKSDFIREGLLYNTLIREVQKSPLLSVYYTVVPLL